MIYILLTKQLNAKYEKVRELKLWKKIWRLLLFIIDLSFFFFFFLFPNFSSFFRESGKKILDPVTNLPNHLISTRYSTLYPPLYQTNSPRTPPARNGLSLSLSLFYR